MKFKSLILVIVILLSVSSFNCLAASNRDKAFEELERDTGGQIEQPRIDAPVQPAPSVPLQQNREPAVPANTYDTGSSREIVTKPQVNEAEETNSSVANRASQLQSTTPIRFGTGVYDITGPAAEVVMMGYANGEQVSAGISQRLYARAYVFANPDGRRVVFVSAELGQLFGSIKQGVVHMLADNGYGSLYNNDNVQLSATHTHAGPGGYSHHAIFNFTTKGYIEENYKVIVTGIYNAIVMAHNNLADGTIRLGSEDLNTASINRSIVAFNKNPEVAGRSSINPASYPAINPEVIQLSLYRAAGPAGAISWFSVHNTSLTRNNLLISSDHKGYAAYLFEKMKGSIQPFVNSGQFIAAFPNGDEGDQSPNINPGFIGPGGKDEFLSMRIIGEREFNVAYSIFNKPNNKPVLGEIDFRHTFVKMPGYVVSSKNVNGAGERTLCDGAYGFSFAAGAEDGPSGAPFFKEGMTFRQKSLAEWTGLSNSFYLTFIPTQLKKDINTPIGYRDDACQQPKPVLIPSTKLKLSGDTLPFQILRLGNVAIIGVPGEMTVQAGRRLRKQTLDILSPLGVNKVILTGLANDYSGYITTPEEYDTQQYEGASTLFGRLTLDAYIQIFSKLATDMVSGKPSVAGPTPPDLSGNQLTLQTGVVYDDKPVFEAFGQALKQPPVSVKQGGVVDVTFRAGHPKNNLLTGSSYYLIERQEPNGKWTKKVWDSVPDGRFEWRRDKSALCLACSFADVHWNVPEDAEPGSYRISIKGGWKNTAGIVTDYQGYTNTFVVFSPCGGEGQRACCVIERDKGVLGKPCTGNLNETGICTGSNCVCGGSNQNGSEKSIGICSKPAPLITVKPAAAPVISACGGLNQRACCASERAGGIFGKPCTGSLNERGRCTGANCTCGGNNPGGVLKSAGMCVR